MSRQGTIVGEMHNPTAEARHFDDALWLDEFSFACLRESSKHQNSSINVRRVSDLQPRISSLGRALRILNFLTTSCYFRVFCCISYLGVLGSMENTLAGSGSDLLKMLGIFETTQNREV